MRKLLLAMAMTGALIGHAAADDKIPLSVEAGQDVFVGNYWNTIHVTPTVDELIIANLEINRNNCFLLDAATDATIVLTAQMGIQASGKALTRANFSDQPRTMKFGETLVPVPVTNRLAPCSAIELKISTNLGTVILSQGNWTWEHSPEQIAAEATRIKALQEADKIQLKADQAEAEATRAENIKGKIASVCEQIRTVPNVQNNPEMAGRVWRGNGLEGAVNCPNAEPVKDLATSLRERHDADMKRQVQGMPSA